MAHEIKHISKQSGEKPGESSPSMDNGNGAVDTIHQNVGNTVDKTTTTVKEAPEKAQKSAAEAFDAAKKGDFKTTAIKAYEAVNTVLEAKNAVTGFMSKISEDVMMPVMKKLAKFKGSAILPVAKQLDPVVGCDVHMVIFPPVLAPVPMPHLYTGIIFYPKDWVSILANTFKQKIQEKVVSAVKDQSEEGGTLLNKHKDHVFSLVMKTLGLNASVKIGNYIPRAVTGTAIKNIPHWPSGPAFHPGFTAAIQKNHGKVFLGSLFVMADEDPMAGCFHLNYDCWDIGIIDFWKFKRGKKKIKVPKEPEDGDPRLQLYAPTSTILALPWSRVLVNSIPTPFNPMSLVDKIFSAGLGKLKKAAGKKASNILHGAANKLGYKPGSKAGNRVHKAICTVTGHPVDVSSGMLFTDNEDFSLPGPIPLSWERTWYSISEYAGPLGHGWHHSYDMALVIEEENNLATVRMNDGRIADLELPAFPGKATFNRKEKLHLHLHKDGYYFIEDAEGLLYKFTDNVYKNPYNKTESKLLQSIASHNGFAIRFNYNDDGCLIKITDSTGRLLKVDNDNKGRIISIHAPHPQENGKYFVIAKYRYSDEGDLIMHADALQQPMLFEYRNHLLVKETWRNGLNWFFEFEGTGTDAKCIHTWGDGDLYNHRLQYNEEQTIVTNSLGHNTIHQHNGQLVHLTIDANGAAWQYRHNRFNELEWTTDPLGNQTGYTHDHWGNTVTVAGPDGSFEETSYYNPQFPHLTTDAMDARGGKWQWQYDQRGNLVKRTNPLKAVTKFTYEDGLLTKITSPVGTETSLQYSRAYNLEQINYPNGTSERLRYDILGNCTEETDVKQNRTVRQYDLLNRPVRIELPDGNTQRFTYDAIDNLTEYHDRQREVKMTYKGMWKLQTRTEGGASIFFGYNTEEQLTRIINENAEYYHFIYDNAGNTRQEIGFDGQQKIFDRNAAGWVTKINRPQKRCTQYNHDQAGRITKVSYHDGSNETYKYDKGLLQEAGNENVVIQFERDVLGRVTKETCNGHEVNSVYDIENNRTTITSSMGANIELGYDVMSNIINQQANGWQSKIKVDEFGLEIEKELLGEIVSKQQRDKLGRVTQHVVDSAQVNLMRRPKLYRKYRWDINDKLRQITDQDSGTTTYEYDKWSNLSKTTFNDNTEQLRNPSAVGNLFETKDRKDRKYDKGGKLLESKTAFYSYDEEGNLMEKKCKNGELWKYEWNAAGMLVKVIRPDKNEVLFTYDALGRRISKKFKKTITKWVWDGNKPLHEWKEFDTKETPIDDIITWIFDEDSFAATAKIKGDKKYSLICDQLGTPIQGYNDEGSLIWQRELDSYGKVKMLHGEEGFCNYLYQGQTLDAETGLAYNRFRYYSSEEGMYVSQDPIGLESGQPNFYAHIEDPNIWIDIFGLNRSTGADRTHVKYSGIKNGEPYSGYASAPSNLNLTPMQIVARRYAGKSDKPSNINIDYSGKNVKGKNIARGLEQIGKGKANLQNPVGKRNDKREAYRKAAEKHLNQQNGCSK